jgi:hypothetical protein
MNGVQSVDFDKVFATLLSVGVGGTDTAFFGGGNGRTEVFTRSFDGGCVKFKNLGIIRSIVHLYLKTKK